MKHHNFAQSILLNMDGSILSSIVGKEGKFIPRVNFYSRKNIILFLQ